MQIASTAQALINVAAGSVTKETELNASLTAPAMEWYVTNMAHAYRRPLEDAIDSAFV